MDLTDTGCDGVTWLETGSGYVRMLGSKMSEIFISDLLLTTIHIFLMWNSMIWHILSKSTKKKYIIMDQVMHFCISLHENFALIYFLLEFKFLINFLKICLVMHSSFWGE